MNKLLCISGLLFFFASCGDPAAKMQTKKEALTDISIGPDDIFDGIKIFQFLQNKKKFVSQANELFLKGTNAFKNNNDLDSALIYFRESIIKEPTAQAYYELGNASKAMKNYDQALKSYKMAEQLNYAPFSNILYNISTVYALQDSLVQAGQYLEYALQAGFSNLDKIGSDKDLEKLRKDWMFSKHMERGIRGMSEPEKLFWLQFKREFPKANLPLTIDWNIPAKLNDNLEFISYDFEQYISEMRDEEFSREVSQGFYYFASIYETDKYTALIYITKDYYMGEHAPVSYTLATFSPTGKLIDKMIIGGQIYFDDVLRKATINNKMEIIVQEYKAIYSKNENEYGYYDNEIERTEELGTKKLKIELNGKIKVV